jgi:hypothetical protein
MGEPVTLRSGHVEKWIGISNPDASIWEGGLEGAAVAPPSDAVPRRYDDDDDDLYNPNDDGPPTLPYDKS